MFNPSNFFDVLFVIPILNALMAIYKLFLLIKLPGALGFALVLLTILIRLIINPLMATQLKNTQKMGKLKPELDELAKAFKDDKQRLYQEQMKLYKEHGINPAAGCLPLLLQMPILIGLYNLFYKLLTNGDLGAVVGEINKVLYLPILKIDSLDLSFFGLNLAAKPSEWQKFGWFLLLVPLITAVLQYYQAKTMGLNPAKSPEKNKKALLKNEEKKKEDDFGESMQKQMQFMMPLMIGFFSFSFPLGLSLYWNTYTVFGIIQQVKIQKNQN
jgi:YidC/Oxa1 family membrane protein insertase